MRRTFARYRLLLIAYLLPQGGKVALLAVLLLGTIGLQLAGPLIIRSFIDTAIGHGALAVLTGSAALYLAVVLVTQATRVVEAYVAEDVAWTATNALRVDVIRHCLRLDMSFHLARTPGELIERVDGDIDTLANFFSRFALTILGNALLLVGVLVALFLVDWRVGLTLTLYSAGGLAVLGRLRTVATPHWTLFRQAFSELFGFLGEWLSGAEDVRANGATAYPLRLFAERLRAYLRPQRTAVVLMQAMEALSDVLLALGTIAAFLLTAYLFGRHAITVGTAFLIVAYTQQLVTPLRQISGQLDDAQQASAGMIRLEELLAIRPTVTDGVGAPLPPGALSVAFRGVTFAYDEGSQVVRDVTFTLAPGRALGVVGRTGSGKSTLTRLLFRLYDPSAGVIELGGVDLRALRAADLRGRVGLVTQEVQLFAASVRDNLTFFDPGIDDGRILTALEDLGLLPWYRALPHGLDSELATGGAGLSAGQAQLLALVRVFLADPSLVIMDEASSRLDPATERQLDQAIAQLLRGRTGILIAHRLRTLRRADDILVLKDGRVVEHGSRVDLAADERSRFAGLLRDEAADGDRADVGGREDRAAGEPWEALR